MTDSINSGWAPLPRQGLIPLYPLSFGQILGRAFAVLKGNPKVLLGFVVGVQTLAMTILTVVIGAVTFATLSRVDTVDPNSPEFDTLMAGSIGLIIIVSIVLGFLVTAVTVLAQGVVVAETGMAALAEKSSLRQLWRRVGPAFWPLIGYTLLLGLAQTIAIGILVVPIVLTAIMGTPGAIAAAALFMIVAALGGLVLPAWLGTKLYLVPAAIVLEGAGPIRGIVRSWKLTRGRFWSTFGVLIILALIANVAAMLVSFAVILPLSFLPAVLFPFGDPAAIDDTGFAVTALIFSVIPSIISFAFTAVLMIVIASGGALCYLDARMRDEGIDLRMQRYVERTHQGLDADDPYTFDPDARPSPYAHTPPPQQQQQPYPPATATPPPSYAPPTAPPAPPSGTSGAVPPWQQPPSAPPV
ncbi:hypothetical protein [Microbacterium amylolyticum]|uniref:MFS family permease n=1 Tax=Microbacterium amylolyticum TaxID=936337 RepID=A0ABS4ZJX3_9MICO|nr:hypothetical protein [Microbacterium amylolyticum]MBP2437594.1 MFS family permease [Microbacterium amylolyticum]